MSRKKATSADIDWYLVSIDRLKKGGAIVVLLLVAGGLGWWWFGAQSPRERARRAVNQAAAALNDLASVTDFQAVRADFERGNARLQDARNHLQAERWPEALAAGQDAASIATMALARIPGEGQFDAQFLTVEGDVQVQKGAQGEWRKASARDPLFNGDWVKTGGSASAELIFVDGSLYTVGSNALLEIYAAMAAGGNGRDNFVQMQIGSVEINTSDDESTVRTPGSQVVVSSKSTAQVGVTPQKETDVVALRGSSSVAPAGGGQPVALAAGQQVAATAQGRLSPVKPVLDPPALARPADNHVFQAGAVDQITLQWEPNPDAVGYQLQVSRSRLFSSLEIDARRNATDATTRVSDQGAFYWRVASIGADGKRGPFSPFRRFRVVGGATGGSVADKTPPVLQLKKPFKIGGAYFLFEGTVEGGASLFINDEEIGVETDGTFKKLVSFTKMGWNTVVIRAVDPSGNQSIKRENIYVEE